MVELKAPFPWFGGKSRAAGLIWDRFGEVPNYVEPFAGSLAVMLLRPHEPRIETVNDLDCYLANFWRATQQAPEEVARHANWPVNEADLHARHRWLVANGEFRQKMRTDPDFYDAKVAGWWVWGISQWIGSGWCVNPEWEGRANPGNGLRGINSVRVRNHSKDVGYAKRPTLKRGGVGVCRTTLNLTTWQQKPDLRGSRGATGRGLHASGKRDGEGIRAWMEALAARLRYARVCCGDWMRVLSPNVTVGIGVTGVLLDPPYLHSAGRDPGIYSEESADVSNAVREWALANGGNTKLRIALCGYEGEHAMPPEWECVPWKASGGYAAARGNTENSTRERVWFSPHCLRAVQQDLFSVRSAP